MRALTSKEQVRDKPHDDLFTKLRDAYEKGGSNVRDLAGKFGVSKTYVHDTIRGNFKKYTAMRAWLVEKICQRYGVDVEKPITVVAKIANGYIIEFDNDLMFIKNLDDWYSKAELKELHLKELKSLIGLI